MIENLLSEVTKAARIEIENRGDCELLSSLILEETDQFISYNTLRRLYGLAPGGKPRRQTLDALALFSGYVDYRNFCSTQPKLNLWKRKAELSHLLAESNFTETVEWFKGVEGQLFKLDLLLTAMRELYLSNRDQDMIQLLDSGAYDIVNQSYSYQIQVAVSLGLLIREQPLDGRFGLLSHPKMVEAVYLRLVDYSALNGYYGHWTRELQLSPPTHESAVFIHCLIQLIAFLNCEQLPSIDMDNLRVHPCPSALLGRIFTVYLMQGDPRSFDQLWQDLLSQDSEEGFDITAYIEPRTFALATANRPLAKWLIDQIKINELTLKQFQIHELHVHFLLNALHSIFEEDHVQATYWMGRFDVDELRRPSFSEFLLFPLRRIQAELNGTAHVFPDELRDLNLRLGYAWFNEQFWFDFFEK